VRSGQTTAAVLPLLLLLLRGISPRERMRDATMDRGRDRTSVIAVIRRRWDSHRATWHQIVIAGHRNTLYSNRPDRSLSLSLSLVQASLMNYLTDWPSGASLTLLRSPPYAAGAGRKEGSDDYCYSPSVRPSVRITMRMVPPRSGVAETAYWWFSRQPYNETLRRYFSHASEMTTVCIGIWFTERTFNA